MLRRSLFAVENLVVIVYLSMNELQYKKRACFTLKSVECAFIIISYILCWHTYGYKSLGVNFLLPRSTVDTLIHSKPYYCRYETLHWSAFGPTTLGRLGSAVCFQLPFFVWLNGCQTISPEIDIFAVRFCVYTAWDLNLKKFLIMLINIIKKQLINVLVKQIPF